ncbi:SgcJ/EcaC family oxidoreductase [Baekduia sp. Peel2402]|uniref:SgcJ/EcaC family oxidoreductase n=1 Tax=Baekduia sp. Peel2402 TaxID=3458296 RepID=UPI00403E76B1
MSAAEPLYRALLAAWNADDAEAFAAPFSEDGAVVGFDGSEMRGRAEIAAALGQVFADHATGSYVGIVRSEQSLAEDVVLLRAVSGVVPAGEQDINPSLNAVQSLVATRREGRWEVDLYHNTPAAWHGRPDDQVALSEELRGQLPLDRD